MNEVGFLFCNDMAYEGKMDLTGSQLSSHSIFNKLFYGPGVNRTSLLSGRKRGVGRVERCERVATLMAPPCKGVEG